VIVAAVANIAVMPVHSVLVCNVSGNILFSQYFRNEKGRRNLNFEESLMIHTIDMWIYADKNRTVTIHDVYFVVFRKVGEFIFFLTGEDDIDEPICTLRL
jgi:hypothetical protein